MTRVEWVASLNEDVRNKFIANIIGDNNAGFIDYWLGDCGGISISAEGIGGVFVWDKTKEGHKYWSTINANLPEA